MITTVAWWDLGGSEATVASLREYLRDEGADPWVDLPGLVLKLWIADADADRWGAVMVWDDPGAAAGPMPPNKATDLIGYPPTHRYRFEVEAAVEGVSRLGSLQRRGPVFEPDPSGRTA